MSITKCTSPRGESLHSLLSNRDDNQNIKQLIHEYGIGVDCHSKFYWVAVWCIVDGEVKKFDLEFDVCRISIEEAKKTIIDTLQSVGIEIYKDKMR